MAESYVSDGTGQRAITLIAVGDVRPNRDEPTSLFRHCREAFSAADLVFGQCEVGFSVRGKPQYVPTPNLILHPHNITALTREGGKFDAMSFASNHTLDFGEEALFDTLDLMREHGIRVVGAGRDIREARAPAIIEKHGVKFGFLAYNSILHPGLMAEENIPGVAPLWASTYYSQWDYQPGTPPAIVTQLVPEYKQAMEEDIKGLRPQVDVLVVSIHAGVHYVPALIPQYQKEAAYAAIDCGADLVLQHHAHMLKGIETYRGKAIFYGLGNFACDPVSKPRPAADPNARGMHERYRIKKVPGYPRYAFHPDGLKTVIAKAYVVNKQVRKVTFIPCYINPDLEPEVLGCGDPRAHEVVDYIERISGQEELNVRLVWDGEEVAVSSGL